MVAMNFIKNAYFDAWHMTYVSSCMYVYIFTLDRQRDIVT